jgi:hypothetical protein
MKGVAHFARFGTDVGELTRRRLNVEEIDKLLNQDQINRGYRQIFMSMLSRIASWNKSR